MKNLKDLCHGNMEGAMLAKYFILPETENKRCPCRAIVKSIYCRIVVSEFKLHSRNYVPFWTNTLRKGMNSLILQAMG